MLISKFIQIVDDWPNVLILGGIHTCVLPSKLATMIKKLLFLLLAILNFSSVQSQNLEIDGILPGIYSTDQYLPLLEGKNVALVANQASKIGQINIVDTLLRISHSKNHNFKIKTVFSPEHGFTGSYDAGAKVSHEKHEFDSVRFISLYGNKYKPTKSDLAHIDVVVFDLQDVGVRFYTYLSTLHYVMEACAEQNIPIVLLDRPNPNAYYVDGPVLEGKFKSFVGLHSVPVVYGMTIGEYAKMIDGEGWLGKGLKCKLTIVPVKNYNHQSKYILPDKPSPNLPNRQSITLYPSLCFFEGTVISVGRGTDFPFQVIGHPHFPIKTFSFLPVSKPGASKTPPHEGQICYGIDLSNIKHDTLLMKKQIQLEYLIDMYGLLKNEDGFFNDYFDLLAGTDKLRKQIIANKTLSEIRNSWRDDIEKFRKIRVKYLLYPD